MKHPISKRSKEEREEILGELFAYFWRKARKSRDDIRPGLKTALGNEKLITEMAGVFAREVSSDLIPPVSLRMLRSLIYRLYSQIVYDSTTDGKRFGNTGITDTAFTRAD